MILKVTKTWVVEIPEPWKFPDVTKAIGITDHSAQVWEVIEGDLTPSDLAKLKHWRKQVEPAVEAGPTMGTWVGWCWSFGPAEGDEPCSWCNYLRTLGAAESYITKSHDEANYPSTHNKGPDA